MQQYLDKIHQVVVDGLGMIRNLVDYRNIEYRGIDIHFEEINLKEFMHKSVKNFRALADKKDIKIHINSSKDIIITSDTSCLGRIADSLLSNAIKFSPEGKEVFVELIEANTNIEMRVKDEARRRGCHAAYIDTFSPVALRTYLRAGYVPFGTLEDFPKGRTRTFLQKPL